MCDNNCVIEGTVKFRDGKKWKSRWCVMRKLSPVADCLHLQLYRDSKDRYKQGQTKASLSLQHFLGLESGFTLDKESHTVAIVCQDVVVVLAFDNRERLMQWQIKLSTHLNDGPHFLVLVSSSPLKTKLPPGPARLHVQERSFCLTTGVPPRVAGQWQIADLRRYGVVDGRFCFEGGSRCLKGEGLYILIADQGDEIMAALQAAATGNLHASRKRPVSRNMSVMDSPARRPAIRAAGVALDLRESEASLASRANSPYTDLESNYGCGDSISNDGWNQPSIERCMSCISKLGAMSRSSTATVTAGPTVGPPCWEHTCDRHSISSSSDSSGWSQAVTRPPQRPPKYILFTLHFRKYLHEMRVACVALCVCVFIVAIATPTQAQSRPVSNRPGRFLSLPNPQKCASRPKQFSYRGHNYFFTGHVPAYANRKMDWLDGRNLCREYCMDLVSLETQEENNMIFRLIQQNDVPFIWTSGRLCDFKGCENRADLEPKNIFGWFWSANREKLSPTNQVPNGWGYNPWSSTGHKKQRQPDNAEFDINGTTESCLSILNNVYNDGIAWHDVACYHEKPVVCEDSDELLNYVRSTNPGLRL